MRLKTQEWLRPGGALGAALAIALGLLLLESRIGWVFTKFSYDIPFAWRQDLRTDEVVIVYIDKASHEELGEPLNQTWPRKRHAQLVDELTSQGARAVVFDVLFSEPDPKDPAADAELIRAVRDSGRVILGADLDTDARAGTMQPEMPFDALREVAAGWGNVRLRPDSELGVRCQLPHVTQVATLPSFPTLAWSAAEAAGMLGRKGRPPEDRAIWLNYYGPPKTIPDVSYYQALTPGFLPAGYFSNKIVFVGGNVPAAAREYDAKLTPYTTWGRGKTPGVEVHATALLNLIRGEWLTRLRGEWLLVLLAGACFGFGFERVQPLRALSLAVGVIILMAVTAHLSVWKLRVWFDWMLIVGVQLPIALVWGVSHNALRNFIARKALQRSLSLYLSPARAAQIIRAPELLRPGAEEREVSLLFTDIADYSTLSQQAKPDELVRVLNEYFQTALDSIHSTDGTVVKFIGDAIFALWNAPETQPHHQQRACRAVLQLRKDLSRFNEDLRRRYVKGEFATAFTFHTRVGLHSGKVFVGNFGSAQRFDYTAIGDGVNLSSRLEGLNKYLGTEILMSDDFRAALNENYVTRFVGKIRPQGFLSHVAVHELIGGPAEAEATREWREAFAAAWTDFSNGRFSLAAEGFRRVCALRASADRKYGQAVGDGVSAFYLRQIPRLEKEPPVAGWSGEVEPGGK